MTLATAHLSGRGGTPTEPRAGCGARLTEPILRSGRPAFTAGGHGLSGPFWEMGNSHGAEGGLWRQAHRTHSSVRASCIYSRGTRTVWPFLGEGELPRLVVVVVVWYRSSSTTTARKDDFLCWSTPHLASGARLTPKPRTATRPTARGYTLDRGSPERGGCEADSESESQTSTRHWQCRQ